MQQKEPRIRILKDGPYLVSGNVPLSEKVIVPRATAMYMRTAASCRSANLTRSAAAERRRRRPSATDRTQSCGFDGTETACKTDYHVRAGRIVGSGIDLLDDGRCAFARFCHRDSGDAWELAADSASEFHHAEAVTAANECPAGRLTAVEKDSTIHEPDYEPGIEILQDPEEEVSSGIFVKGGIPIESADGSVYEIRNRVVLCRCGLSKNKPFCDATHVSEEFSDHTSDQF